jgi:hypothetical protein
MKVNLIKINQENGTASVSLIRLKGFEMYARKLMILKPKDSEFELFCKALAQPGVTIKVKPDGIVTIRFTMECKLVKAVTTFEDKPEEDFSFTPKKAEDYELFKRSYMIACKHDGQMQRQLSFECLMDAEDISVDYAYEDGKVSDR